MGMVPLLAGNGAIYAVWWISLAVAVAVLLVVVALLTLILRSARRIDAAAGAIWIVGQRIANNTIHIDLLRRTNETVAGILDAAGGIALAASRIEQHAAACPGCPACAIGPGTGRR